MSVNRVWRLAVAFAFVLSASATARTGVASDFMEPSLDASPQGALRQSGVSDAIDVAGLDAIGRVNVAGFQAAGHCTGALVGARQVITAAHCFRRPDGTLAKPGQVHFVAGLKIGGDFAGHAKAACIRLLEGEPGLYSDAALIVLDRELGISPVAVDYDAPVDERFTTVGFPQERAHAPTAHTGCAIQENFDGVWLLNCKTNFGGSGGPVIRVADGAPRISAIVIAKKKDNEAFALAAAQWSSLLETTRCE